MVTVHAGDDVADGGPEPAHHRMRQCFEHGDVETPRAARRRDLGADETGADDHDARVVVEPAADLERVVERAQHEQAVEVGLVRQPSWRAARCDDAAVERHARAVVELYLVVGDVERDRARPEPQVEVEVGDAVLAELDLVGVRLAGQHFLRQRREGNEFCLA